MMIKLIIQVGGASWRFGFWSFRCPYVSFNLHVLVTIMFKHEHREHESDFDSNCMSSIKLAYHKLSHNKTELNWMTVSELGESLSQKPRAVQNVTVVCYIVFGCGASVYKFDYEALKLKR